MGPGFASQAVHLALLLLVSTTNAQDTGQFSIQHLQQQLQLQQQDVMVQLQDLQRQRQVFTQPEQQQQLEQRQQQLLLRLQEIQDQLQGLQQRFQQQFDNENLPPARQETFNQQQQTANSIQNAQQQQLEQHGTFQKQTPVRQQVSGQHQQPQQQEPVREQVFGKPELQQPPINQEPVRQQQPQQPPIRQEPVKQQVFGQQQQLQQPSINQEPVRQQPLEKPERQQQPITQEPVKQQVLGSPEQQTVQHPEHIFFSADPPTDLGPPCANQAGEAGRCRPLVKCVTFYAEIPELRKQPCQLRKEEFGVCCPLKKRPVAVPPGLDRPNQGVLRPPPPPRVEIPPLSPQQLDQAANEALDKQQKRQEIQEELVNNNILVEEGTPAGLHQEFFTTTNETLKVGSEAQKNVDASVSLVNKFHLTPEQGTFALPSFSVLNTVIADTCPKPPPCQPAKYRTIDGSCNNLFNKRWGQIGTALQRILPPKYGDGVNSPRTAGSGKELPSARFISTEIATELDREDDNFTLLVMQWGQFLDHDLTHTPISKGKNQFGISCCKDGDFIQDPLRHPDCFAIPISRNDTFFSQFKQGCMEFVRSLPAPRPECNFGPREQMNQITAFIDASNVYGSRDSHARQLREFRGGRLKVQNVQGRQMLPENRNECTDDDDKLACFRAGDGRVNEQVELTVMHTLWMREHNRVADQLIRLNPGWSDEALYQEARRIVVAEIQHITYNEFLPLILGRNYMDKFELTPREKGYTQLYDETLNPSITNAFATAAFRFGHTLIQSNMHGYSRFGNVKENLVLHHHQFSPFVLYQEGALDNFVRGLSTQTCQKFDRFFSRELTNHLFQGFLPFGLDLVALNIQRGRDHGLPPYNDWREVCGLPRANKWDDLLDVMDSQTVAALSSLYGSVEEVDLFIAGVAEKPLTGALLGQTFVCLVGDQFARLRRGDLFFYEEGNKQSSFSENQLMQLRKSSLSRVLCDNSDNVVLMQPLAFFRASFANQRVPCSSDAIPRVDLSAWLNEPVTS